MSRKGPSKKHVVLPDPIYGSTVVAQLINKILLDGKKSIAEDIVYWNPSRPRRPMPVSRPLTNSPSPCVPLMASGTCCTPTPATRSA